MLFKKTDLKSKEDQKDKEKKGSQIRRHHLTNEKEKKRPK